MVRVIKMSPNTPRQATRIHSVVDNGSGVEPDGGTLVAGVLPDAGTLVAGVLCFIAVLG